VSSGSLDPSAKAPGVRASRCSFSGAESLLYPPSNAAYVLAAASAVPVQRAQQSNTSAARSSGTLIDIVICTPGARPSVPLRR